MRRTTCFLTALALVFAQNALTVSAGTIVGTWEWRSMMGPIPCVTQTVYDRNGGYSELGRCGPYASHQTGKYKIFGSHLARTVTDWNPKRYWMIDPCPGDSSKPGCGHWQQYQRPIGGTFEITFVGANTLRIRDVAGLLFTGQAELHRLH
jgi:hypothetical protein